MQVQPRQRDIEGPGPPHIRRRKLRPKQRRFAVATAHLGQLHRDRSNPGENVALGLETVAHHGSPAARIATLRHRTQKLLQLHGDRFLQQATRSTAQPLGELVVHVSWSAKPNNAILLHGGVPPSCVEHRSFATPISPHRYAAYLTSRRTPLSSIAQAS